MDRLKALSMYYGYKTLVIRDGSIHPLNIADLAHADDSEWNVKLILYPLQDPSLCPGTLEEAAGFFEGLKTGHFDFLNLIENGLAISVDSLEEDPYRSTP
jgi:hypothetical protein